MTPSEGNPLVAPAALASLAAPERVETIEVERGRVAARRPALAWTATCLAVDAAMLVTATAAAELGSSVAGVGATPILWLAAFPLLVLGLLSLRGMYARR